MKKSRFLLVLLIGASIHYNTDAQFTCGFDQLQQERLKTDPNFLQLVKAFEGKYRERLNRPFNPLSPQSPFEDTIPVVIHVIHTGDPIGSTNNPSDDRINATLDFVNQVYAGTSPGIQGTGDIGLHFVLAKRDPYCNPTNGIERLNGSLLPGYPEFGISYECRSGRGVCVTDLMKFSRWDPYRYYNIWLVTQISSVSSAGYAGFAFFPGDPNMDGAVIVSYAMAPGLTVLPHELGHAFSLYHVFEGSDGSHCQLNNDCNQDGDQICDTDPIKKPSGEDRSGINPCTGTPFNINTELNFMNYLCCPVLFTEQQKLRMQTAALHAINRDTLSKSPARFPVDAAPVCSFPLVLYGQLQGNDVLLNWSDPGNHQSDYEIEKSYDGIHFTTIHQTSFISPRIGYSYFDPAIAQVQNYYRLRQDISAGNSIYSNIVLMNNPFSKPGEFIFLNNPVRDNIDLQFGFIGTINTNSSTYLTNAEIRVTDITGKVVIRLSEDIKELQRFRIPVKNLRPGIYIIQVIRNGTLYSKKILKL